MPDPAKRDFSERDICSKFITPAVEAGNKWDFMSQIAATHLLDATVLQILA